MSLDYGESWKLRLSRFRVLCNTKQNVLRIRRPKRPVLWGRDRTSWVIPLGEICGVNDYTGGQSSWVQVVTTRRTLSLEARQEGYLPGYSEVDKFVEHIERISGVNQRAGLETDARMSQAYIKTMMMTFVLPCFGTLFVCVLIYVVFMWGEW